jgi:hypothetical protein
MSVGLDEVGVLSRARGTVIKVPDATPGLLIVDGRQLPFSLEGRWRSPVAPAANMSVDVELDPTGVVVARSEAVRTSSSLPGRFSHSWPSGADRTAAQPAASSRSRREASAD